jgi:hypothetical protein
MPKLLGVESDTPCTSTGLAVERIHTLHIHTARVVERDTSVHCTSILLVVQKDTSCTSMWLKGKNPECPNTDGLFDIEKS